MLRAAAMLCGLFTAANASELRATPYFSARVFGVAEPVSVYQYASDFEGKLRKGADGALFARVEAGLRINAWEFSLVRDQYYVSDANRDTAELYFRDQNNLSLPPGRTFAVDLDVVVMEAQGLRLGRLFSPVRNLNMDVGVAYLEGKRLVDGVLEGTAVQTTPTQLDVAFGLNYHYSHDEKLFDRNVRRPEGEGFTVDWSGEWRVSSLWTFSWLVDDLYGRMYWERAPFTTAQANTQVSGGLSGAQPVLTGLESSKDFTQRLKPHGAVNLLARFGGHRLGVGGHYAQIDFIPSVIWSPLSTSVVTCSFHWLPEHDALGLELASRWLRFSWIADDLNYKQAHIANLQLAIQIPL